MWLFEFGVGLYSMTHGQHSFVIQFQFGGEFSGGLAFANASHQQDNLPGRPLTALKDCSGIQVVNRSAMFTTLNFQFAGLSAPKLSGLFYASLALGTLQSLWMKMLEYPLSAIFMVKQFCDWKFHAQSLSLHRTSFTHEPISFVIPSATIMCGNQHRDQQFT